MKSIQDFYWDYVDPLQSLLNKGTNIMGTVFIKDDPLYLKLVKIEAIRIGFCGSNCDCPRYRALVTSKGKDKFLIPLDHIKLTEDSLALMGFRE